MGGPKHDESLPTEEVTEQQVSETPVATTEGSVVTETPTETVSE